MCSDQLDVSRLVNKVKSELSVEQSKESIIKGCRKGTNNCALKMFYLIEILP